MQSKSFELPTLSCVVQYHRKSGPSPLVQLLSLYTFCDMIVFIWNKCSIHDCQIVNFSMSIVPPLPLTNWNGPYIPLLQHSLINVISMLYISNNHEKATGIDVAVRTVCYHASCHLSCQFLSYLNCFSIISKNKKYVSPLKIRTLRPQGRNYLNSDAVL